MDRRTVLGAVGTGMAALAGCSAGDSELASGPGGAAASTATPTPDLSPRYREPVNDNEAMLDYPPERIDAEVEVGSRDDPAADSHGVSIRNGADAERTVELRVADRDAGAVLHEDDHAVSPDGRVSISLVGAAGYLVDVGVPALGTGASVTLGPGNFDCNASTTHVLVPESGDIVSTTISTMMACPSDPDGR